MRDLLLFHPSSVGRLMTEPKTQKEGPLSVGARTYVRELVAQAVFGVDFEVTSKEMEKGIACEVPHSIPLFNRVTGRNLVKNTQRFENDYLTGEPDLIGDDDVVDIKTAWSIATFPICWEDVNPGQRQLYEWQLRAYLQLTNKARASIAYALVTTPDDLMPNWEPQSLHFVEHIPEHHRLTTWSIERDAAKEAAMVEKIKHARAYYREVVEEFDRTHKPHAADAAQAMNAPRQRREAAAPTKPTAPADALEPSF